MSKVNFDYSRLKGRIIEKFGTAGEFAAAIGISLNSVSRILNGKQSLKIDELYEWKKALDISDDEVVVFFCTEKVAE